MNPVIALDSQALSLLAAGSKAASAQVRAAMTAAQRLNREVVIPAVVLAELYRGPKDDQMVDSCLNRETGILVLDTDKPFARMVGGVLAGADVGSEHMVDAHVVAAAVVMGGGVVMTSDVDDLEMLSAPYFNVQIART